MRLTSHFFDKARTCIVSVLVLVALSALAPVNLSAQAEPEEEEDQNFGPVYVRRFSAGGKFRFLPLKTIEGGTLNTTVTDTVFFDANTSSNPSYYSFGLTSQVLVTNKWAVAVEAMTHKFEYNALRDVTTFIVDPFENILLETRLVSEDENTIGRVWDIPVLLRYYTKSRYTRGPRVFFEGGLTVRRVGSIKTSVETTTSTTDPDVEDMTDCCDTTPITSANPNALGGAVGIGVQVIDDVGVRVVPGFRYTRWFANAIDDPPTRTNQHQIEASIALTF